MFLQVANAEQGKGLFEKLVWLPVVEGYMRNNPLIVYPMLRTWTYGEVRTVRAMFGFNSGELKNWGKN